MNNNIDYDDNIYKNIPSISIIMTIVFGIQFIFNLFIMSKFLEYYYIIILPFISGIYGLIHLEFYFIKFYIYSLYVNIIYTIYLLLINNNLEDNNLENNNNINFFSITYGIFLFINEYLIIKLNRFVSDIKKFNIKKQTHNNNDLSII